MIVRNQYNVFNQRAFVSTSRKRLLFCALIKVTKSYKNTYKTLFISLMKVACSHKFDNSMSFSDIVQQVLLRDLRTA